MPTSTIKDLFRRDEVRNSKGRKVRSWYIEAGGIHPHLSNRLLPNLPQAAENNS